MYARVEMMCGRNSRPNLQPVKAKCALQTTHGNRVRGEGRLFPNFVLVAVRHRLPAYPTPRLSFPPPAPPFSADEAVHRPWSGCTYHSRDHHKPST